ncbi:MAG: ATP-dependent Clp protease proteolytic subunit [Firmicutes bacterium]|nr:ATP-dependent Clp protease proteolytic subunit [Candidatus Colivicinus equi]
MEILLPNNILNGDGNNPYPSPEEYTYWRCRENRTFFVDYEIGDMYELVELSKVIIQMNFEERNIPKEELKPIYIFIHSFGGDVYQGNFFADLLISSRIPIVTVAMGTAMSSGFIIFLAGHRRYMFNHSQLLCHEGYSTIQGTASEVEQAQKNYKRQLEDMKAYVLSRTEMDEKTFNKNKSKDWYLTKEEIEKYKIATVISSFDEIV